MDRKSRRSVAVTAGLAAVLALSPVVAPAVTALAQETSGSEASARIASELKVTVNFYASDDADKPFFTYTDTYENNWSLFGTPADKRPTFQEALDALYAAYPDYQAVEAWQPNNTTDLSSLWDDPGRPLGEKASMGAGDSEYNLHPYKEKQISYTVVDEDNTSIVYGTVDTVVGANMFEAMADFEDPTKEGFAFSHYTWAEYPNNPFGKLTYASPLQTTILAHFDFLGNVATVTFDYNTPGVDNVERQVAVGGTVSEPPAPQRDGYTFDGWYTDSACTNAYDFSTQIAGHRTLYAKWTPKQFTVTFEDGVEGNDVVSSTVSYGEKVVEPDDPTRVGYDFAGWFTDEACTKAYDFAAPVTDNMTLYAKWTPVVDPTPDPETKTFSVTLNDGLADTEDQVITIAEGETIDSSAIKAPSYDGWTFVGWFADSDLTQEWDFSTPVTSDMTLWAGWLRNDVDGSGVTDDTETATDDVEKDDNKAEKDNDPAVPDTGDATVAVYGIAAVGAALTGAGALIRRRR